MLKVIKSRKKASYIMREIYAAVVSLGGNTSKCGYSYLASSGKIIKGLGRFPRNELMEKIYEPIAKLYHTKPSLVAREIARAVEEIYDHGDREKLEVMLGHRLSAKPTPAEVMQSLANSLSFGQDAIL